LQKWFRAWKKGKSENQFWNGENEYEIGFTCAIGDDELERVGNDLPVRVEVWNENLWWKP